MTLYFKVAKQSVGDTSSNAETKQSKVANT